MNKLVFSVLLLGGCATNWQPTLDISNSHGKTQNDYYKDMSECKTMAYQVVNPTYSTLQNGAIGAAVGAGAGALTGLIFGNPGAGAATGAVIGSVGAGATTAVTDTSNYKSSYINCLRNRGWNVIN